MKRIISIICLCFSVFTIAAQVPQAFNFQGVVRDQDGKLMEERTLSASITIYEGSATGRTVYKESFGSKTNKAGVVSLEIGRGRVISGNFADINWKNGVFFMNTTLEITGVSGVVDLGTVQLLSVPYALYAENAGDGIWEQSSDAIFTEGPVRITDKNGDAYALIYTSPENSKNGVMAVSDGSDVKALMATIPTQTGSVGTVFASGQDSEYKVALIGDNATGLVSVTDSRNEALLSSTALGGYNADENLMYLLGFDDNAGGLTLYGKNKTKNVILSYPDDAVNYGYIGTYNANGGELVSITNMVNNSSYGAIAVYANGVEKGSLYVASNGKSRLVADELYDSNGYSLRSSTADYTVQTKSRGSSACYVTEESDQQVIIRGTAALQNGKFTVLLPDEAAAKIQENTSTIQIVPLSASSKGLAVTDKQTNSFTVVELMSGSGSYEFDWTLTALRKKEASLRSNILDDVKANSHSGNSMESSKAKEIKKTILENTGL